MNPAGRRASTPLTFPGDRSAPDSDPPTTGHGRDETTDLTRELCRRIEHREWVTEPERVALARLVSHVAARTVITRADAALGDEIDRALHVHGVWGNVDAALGELLDATANRIRP